MLAGLSYVCQASGKHWCDLYVSWSNTGAYLLTYHTQGVALWAGPDFVKVARLAHRNVAVAQWSKTDRYLVTYSYQNMPQEPPGEICVWDVKDTIAQARPVLLHRCPVEPFGKGNFFKWSHDDKFVAIGKSRYLRQPDMGEQVSSKQPGWLAGWLAVMRTVRVGE